MEEFAIYVAEKKILRDWRTVSKRLLLIMIFGSVKLFL